MKAEQNPDFLSEAASNTGKQVISSWVNSHGDDLYSWACHKTSDDDLAQDLVQETFLSAFQSYKSFKGKGNPKTWLFAILNNKIIDHYRKAAHSASRLETEAERNAAKISDSTFNEEGGWNDRTIHSLWSSEPNLLDDQDFNGVMDKCMSDLPNTWRLTIHAKYMLEKNSQEICQELDITPSNLWQVLHRAKLMLKKCLELHWFKK